MIVPGALDRFVFGKLALAALGVALAYAGPVSGRLPTAARWMLAVAGAGLIVSALLSGSPWAAFAGRSEHYEGTFVVVLYVLCGAVGCRVIGTAGRYREPAFKTMAVVCCAVGFVAVLEAFGLRPLSSNLSRPGSLLGNASDEGALAVLYGVALAVRAMQQPKAWAWLGAGAALVTVVLSASRGALIGLVVAFVLVALFGNRLVRAVTAGVLLLAAAMAAAVPVTRSRILDASPLAQHTVSGRYQLWDETVKLVVHHPLLGVGPSQFENAIVGYHSRQWETTVGPANPPESPHNVLLQALSAGGPVVLLATLGLLVLVGRAAWPRLRARDTWALASTAGLIGYGVALMFHLTSPGTTIPAAAMAGALLAVSPAVQSKFRPAWSDRALACAGAALTLVFVLAAAAEITLAHATNEVRVGHLSAATRDFQTAHVLRPWDVDLPAQAVHAFAAVAELTGRREAITDGQHWQQRTGLVGDDEQVAEDNATLLEAAGDYRSALSVIQGQLHRDRFNPLLLLRRGVLYAELHRYQDAARDFHDAADISPTSPEPWRDLQTLYGLTGQRHLQEHAKARATRLHDSP